MSASCRCLYASSIRSCLARSLITAQKSLRLPSTSCVVVSAPMIFSLMLPTRESKSQEIKGIRTPAFSQRDSGSTGQLRLRAATCSECHCRTSGSIGEYPLIVGTRRDPGPQTPVSPGDVVPDNPGSIFVRQDAVGGGFSGSWQHHDEGTLASFVCRGRVLLPGSIGVVDPVHRDRLEGADVDSAFIEDRLYPLW